MGKKRFLTRFMAAPLAVAVATGGSLLLSGVANAAPPPGTEGSLTFNPTSGLDTTVITATTSGGCAHTTDPTTDPDSADLEVTGPVGAATPTFPPGTVITSTESTSFSNTAPFNVQEGLSLKDSADILHTTIQPGEYDFTVNCQNSNFLTSSGTFTGAIFFTDSTNWNIGNTPPPTTPPTTPPPPPPSPPCCTPTPPAATTIPTTTTLLAAPNPGFIFFPEILMARVAPFNAAGTVQFFDGSTALGTPIPVRVGLALLFVHLPQGNHSLTASYSPANPAAGGCAITGGFFNLSHHCSARFAPSMSPPVSLTVKSLF